MTLPLPESGIALAESGILARWLPSIGIAACIALSVFGTAAHAADVAKGRRLFETHCVACHGNNGRGVLPGAPDLTRQDALLKPDLTLLLSIRNGRNAMPAFQGILSDRDIMDVIAYTRTLH